jgi:hypothetical protein
MELYTYMPRYVIPVEVFVKLFKQVKECMYILGTIQRENGNSRPLIRCSFRGACKTDYTVF